MLHGLPGDSSLVPFSFTSVVSRVCCLVCSGGVQAGGGELLVEGCRMARGCLGVAATRQGATRGCRALWSATGVDGRWVPSGRTCEPRWGVFRVVLVSTGRGDSGPSERLWRALRSGCCPGVFSCSLVSCPAGVRCESWVLDERREGWVVRVSGGVQGCGFFCCVVYEGVFLVEWGRTVLGWVGSGSPTTVRFWDNALG